MVASRRSSPTAPTPQGPSAAADNGFGTIGVAPEADLLLGKVLPDSGCGGDGPILAGIRWAGGPANADVISLSLGAPLLKSGYPRARLQ